MSRTITLSLFPLPPYPERDTAVFRYQRHQPEQTLLYRIIEQHYPKFIAHLAAQDKTLPEYVTREFDDYLKCGRLEYGFLRVRCSTCRHEQLVAFSCKRRGFCPSCGARRMAESAALLVDEVLPQAPMRQWVLSVPFPLRFLFATQPAIMGEVLGIVTRTITTHLIKKAGHSHASAHTGAVTLIQRFGSSLNLNIHFHILFLDGVYVSATRGADSRAGRPRFQRVPSPSTTELTALLHTLSHRIARYLERQGLLQRDAENSYLALNETDDKPMDRLHGHSITYRIAAGPNEGRKVFTLQTLPPTDEPSTGIANVAGFSLHASVAAEAHQRDKLERLVRYITRPALSEKRLSLIEHGYIRYQLKTPYRDGTTHIFFEPLDFIARLAALVPSPRVHLIRYHGVFAPNHRSRADITQAKRGKRFLERETKTPAESRAAMTWAQRLKRVFNIDIETCPHCQGRLKIISCIDDPAVIQKILTHLAATATAADPSLRPLARAPPA